MCMRMFLMQPQWPWCMKGKRAAPPFYGKDEVHLVILEHSCELYIR